MITTMTTDAVPTMLLPLSGTSIGAAALLRRKPVSEGVPEMESISWPAKGQPGQRRDTTDQSLVPGKRSSPTSTSPPSPQPTSAANEAKIPAYGRYAKSKLGYRKEKRLLEIQKITDEEERLQNELRELEGS
jgi:hypothetical protein